MSTPETEASASLQQSTLYPKVMYRIIDGYRNGWLWKRDWNHQRDVSIDDPNSLPHALIQTQHARITEALLENVPDPDVYAGILYGHLKQGEFRKVFVELRRNHKQNTSFYYSDLIDQIFDANASDDLIEECAHVFRDIDEQSCVKTIIERLWKIGRHPLSEHIISNCVPDQQQPLMRVWHLAAQKLEIDAEQITGAIDTLCAVEQDETNRLAHYEIRNASGHLVSSFIRELDEQDADLSLLRCARESQEAHVQLNDLGLSFSSSYEIDDKILDDLLERRDFAGANEFNKAIDGRSYMSDRIAESKIAHAEATGDAELHKEGLADYTEAKECRCAKLQEKQRYSESENGFDRWSWHDRIELHRETAWKHAETALYELRHGDADVAQSHTEQMIAANDAIGVPGSDDCPDYHFKTLRKHRRAVKRSLKGRFLQAGFFHVLPDRDGWNASIKDPDQRQAECEARREAKEQLRSGSSQDYEQEYEREQAESITKTKALIAEGKVEEAQEELLSGCHYYPGETDWTKAVHVIEAQPAAFPTLQKKLTEKYFKGSNDFHDHKDWKGLARFYTAAHCVGALTEEDWNKLFRGLHDSRSTHDGLIEIKHDFVVSFVDELIKSGDIALAWQMYERMSAMDNGSMRGTSSIAANTHQACLALFVRVVEPLDKTAQGVASSLQAMELPVEAPMEERVAYWNTEGEMRHMQEQEEPAKQAEQQLIGNCTTPSAVRAWTRLMAMGSVRTHHQKKDSLTAVYNADCASAPMRWRIIDALIEHSIPGVLSFQEINRKDTPLHVTKYFFRKLVAKGILHKYTSGFIVDEHIPYLRRLVSEFPNEFNTVMETLEQHCSMSHNHGALFVESSQEQQKTTFQPSDWNGVMITLRQLGVFTPGIYAEAREKKFDPRVLNTIGEKVHTLRRQLFSSKPMESDLSTDLQAEIIYAAYKPPNMALHAVRRLCDSVQDCSHHLDRFTFPEEGYVLDLHAKKDMKLKDESEKLPSLNTANSTRVLYPSEKGIQQATKALCNIGRLRALESIQIDDILIALQHDSFLGQSLRSAHQARTEDSQYRALVDLQEAMGIYLTDNLEGMLRSFFTVQKEHISKLIASLADSIRKPKLHTALGKQCHIELDTSLDDTSLAAKVIALVILQKTKPLKEVQRDIANDLTKFVAEDGGSISADLPKLRAIVSKNKASFFGKASAGICTDNDTELFHREDHFHINIIDDEKQICVGNVQAYIMEHDGKPHLLLRGVNPSTNLLKEVDAGAFCEAVINIGKQFAEENNLAGVILSQQERFLALSNRLGVAQYLTRTYRKQRVTLKPFRIARAENAVIDSGYLAAEFGTESAEFVFVDTPEDHISYAAEPVASFC